MAASFRLLSAYGNWDFSAEKSRLEPDRKPAGLDVHFSNEAGPPTANSFVSIVIGRNGVGKSRLLSGIAKLFDQVDRDQPLGPRGIEVSHVTYKWGQHLCEIAVGEEGRVVCMLDHRLCSPADLPWPTRIVAITTTPFDKFKVPASLLGGPASLRPRAWVGDTSERYVYFGLRYGMRNYSTTAVVYRALDSLFDASRLEDERRSRIAEVFTFLGYQPAVEVEYELRHTRSWVEEIANGRPPQTLMDGYRARRIPFELRRMIEIASPALGDLQEACQDALRHYARGKLIRLRANFDTASADGDGFSRNMQLLRRAGLVKVRSVELQHLEDDTILDLRRASSGELGIVTSFLGLASVIEDGSLVLIDEPEISLHPEWQIQYVDLLLQTFRNFKGCHYILATHSPLILSDISPENSALVCLDKDNATMAPAGLMAGKSPDFLLATAFRAPGRHNLYLKQQIIKVLRLAADGDTESDDFRRTLEPMVDLLPTLEADNPIAKLIQELRAVAVDGSDRK
jgi:predicted ATPase